MEVVVRQCFNMDQHLSVAQKSLSCDCRKQVNSQHLWNYCFKLTEFISKTNKDSQSHMSLRRLFCFHVVWIVSVICLFFHHFSGFEVTSWMCLYLWNQQKWTWVSAGLLSTASSHKKTTWMMIKLNKASSQIRPCVIRAVNVSAAVWLKTPWDLLRVSAARGCFFFLL